MINFCSCALPASRQRYLNSGCPENVKNVAKTVNRPLRHILDPNFPASSPLLLLPQLIFSISISLEQNFSFLYHYSYPLFSSSPRSIFFFFHSRINIKFHPFFFFILIRIHDSYIYTHYISFETKRTKHCPVSRHLFPPLPSLDRTSGKSRDSTLKLTETRVCAAIKARRAGRGSREGGGWPRNTLKIHRTGEG